MHFPTLDRLGCECCGNPSTGFSLIGGVGGVISLLTTSSLSERRSPTAAGRALHLLPPKFNSSTINEFSGITKNVAQDYGIRRFKQSFNGGKW
jgi:hypothetical protein